jgi:tetratricopeptide (TPR) repeat protein
VRAFAVPARRWVVLHALAALMALTHTPTRACTPFDGQPLEAALAQVPACQAHAPWLAWLGDRLNRVGRHAEAFDHLERALLLQPALVPAQLGYLLALAGTGDLEAALAWANQLLVAGSLPPEAAQQLARRVARSQQELQAPAQPATSRTRVLASVRLGYDSNPLGAPSLKSLPLILAGQPVDLPLDDAYRSRPSSYLRIDAGVDHVRFLEHLVPGLRLNVAGLLRRRSSGKVPQSDLGQGQVVVELSQAPPREGAGSPGYAGWYASASAATLEAAAGTRYRTLGAGGGLLGRLSAAGAPCEARAGLEAQQRTLLSNPVLSGLYVGVLGLLRCDLPVVQAWVAPAVPAVRPAWQALLLHGTDQPSNADRPGGAQRQTLLRLTALWGSWLVELDAERRRDAAFYSALMGDQAREIERRAVRLEWRRAVSPPWNPAPSVPGAGLDLRAGLEWSNQRAGLELFGARTWGPYVALGHNW